MNANCPTFNEFFVTEKALTEEIAKTCDGGMSTDECWSALKTMVNNKTPGTAGLTSENLFFFGI